MFPNVKTVLALLQPYPPDPPSTSYQDLVPFSLLPINWELHLPIVQSLTNIHTVNTIQLTLDVGTYGRKMMAVRMRIH